MIYKIKKTLKRNKKKNLPPKPEHELSSAPKLKILKVIKENHIWYVFKNLQWKNHRKIDHIQIQNQWELISWQAQKM